MRIERTKVKRVAIILFGVGVWGIGMSVYLHSSLLLFFAGIDLAMGVIFLMNKKDK